MSKKEQLTLSVQLPDDEVFDSYISESNKLVVGQLSTFVEDSKHLGLNHPTCFYIFGLTGVGKSHLLHASSTYASQLGITSVCLSCVELLKLSVDVLDGIEKINFICIDDIQLLADNYIWQRAVFDLYNRVLENNGRIVISGDQSVNQLGLTLPDLTSRLSWGLTEQLKPLSDNEKVIALQYRALKRGLLLTDEAANFLIKRLSRAMADLIMSLDILDKASIREQRKITIPFIKDVLNIA